MFLSLDVAFSTHAMPTPSKTSRHGEIGTTQVASEPGLNDRPQLTGHKGNHPNAVGSDQLLQRPRNGTTNKSADSKFYKTKYILNRELIRQDFLGFSDNFSRIDLHEVDLPGGVENRRNTILPL
ncbi:hypothetical protein DAMNIGENAA_21850 [Desulforhabdus amnigena]|jgi:hypothetical protein|uniref:Uncharacterized protein n=1 Tax=Desulforhabdus amnigena TaxID=40218 RepID=A0A9W6D5Q9_9BACT|nr:hypothetical protein DAMNIGENAA_21850 [Desulforhabdus amnigena]